MKSPFELADDLIKKAAGADLKAIDQLDKPEFVPVNYAFHFGQLRGAIQSVEAYIDHPDLLRGQVVKLVETEREISDFIDKQHVRNMRAPKP